MTTLREALQHNLQDRITINGLSYKVKEVSFSEIELESEVNIYENHDIDTSELYKVAEVTIDNNYISFLIK